MRGAPDPEDAEERFTRLYLLHRNPCIRYAARLIAGPAGTNSHILGVEAAEIYDEAMNLYHRQGEHLADHGDHERHIKRRVRLCVIAWLRKKTADKRTPPGPTVSLDAPLCVETEGDESGVTLDPPDHRSGADEAAVDLADAIERLPNSEEQSAARARARGETYREIADASGVSEEAARQRVRRAAGRLAETPPTPPLTDEDRTR